MATRNLTSIDLSTASGRYYARKLGFDIPKRRHGVTARGFDGFVTKSDGCWEWTGAKVSGYGTFNEHGKHWRAHRYAWERANGPIPEGLVVMHRCDNPSCVRLDHLQIGTQLENRRDAVAKGRTARGSATHAAKLSEQDVRDIRANHQPGRRNVPWNTAWIAVRFDIDVSAVRLIVRRRNWKHV